MRQGFEDPPATVTQLSKAKRLKTKADNMVQF
jgi:hypothetical protein